MNKSYIILFLFLLSSCTNKRMISNNSKASINEKNENLIECLNKKEYDKAIYWINNGANPNIVYKNQSLLSYATFHNWTDFSIKLIEAGADINWIDPSDHVSVFSNVIHNNNIVLGELFLSHRLDLTYRDNAGHNYFDQAIFNKYRKDNPYFNDYRLAYMLLEEPSMKQFVRNNEGTLYTIIRNWSAEMPNFIDLIYGVDYDFSDAPPVLLIAISENEIDALKYFIKKNISIDKKYYLYELNNFYTPLELAMDFYQDIIHETGEDSEYSKKMREICILLQNTLKTDVSL